MWTTEILGTDVYHIVAAFCIYSMLGWLVESIYMSLCNRSLTNRGFAKGPFCPIYGFGAILGNWMLQPFVNNNIQLYIAAAIIATLFEYLVGVMMIKTLGGLWWDYNEKFCNYKGIICLESTIAWGFYGLIIVHYLNDAIMTVIDRSSIGSGLLLIRIFLFVFMIDFICQLFVALGTSVGEQSSKMVDKFMDFKARWY